MVTPAQLTAYQGEPSYVCPPRIGHLAQGGAEEGMGVLLSLDRSLQLQVWFNAGNFMLPLPGERPRAAARQEA